VYPLVLEQPEKPKTAANPRQENMEFKQKLDLRPMALRPAEIGVAWLPPM
jgi:hypothetical protein